MSVSLTHLRQVQRTRDRRAIHLDLSQGRREGVDRWHGEPVDRHAVSRAEQHDPVNAVEAGETGVRSRRDGRRINVPGMRNDECLRPRRRGERSLRLIEVCANLRTQHSGGFRVEHSGHGSRTYGRHRILQRSPPAWPYKATASSMQLCAAVPHEVPLAEPGRRPRNLAGTRRAEART